ncbi:MAG: hypothetical protein TR69_WS6001000412 [candidate division WS6 bacterium OLB20]|uniref:Uncharacterized protein n=1 Tax=candidate division WS6 bacterium OLB20 TaxID=1617426 RepID=A0A136LXN5_9BACT|nr:MAG: hypothetical protein TR69_WS6001000412 [candidate division WS6 bacterium OLB20]
MNVPTMGLLAILNPHTINSFTALVPAMITIAITLLVFLRFAYTGQAITRKEGYALVAIYVIWLTAEMFVSVYQY